MDGIVEIKISELEGLEEAFAENTISCPDMACGNQ
jgi:hypothetical protein